MIQPGTHGVSVPTDTRDTAKRFRRSAYTLGSAKVRSRYSYDPGPSAIPPGGASLGVFASKLGTAVLAGRNNREFRDQERQNATLADEKNTLEMEALRQRVNPKTHHYLTPEGRGLDLSPEQAALYEHRNREKEPTPRPMVKLSRAFPELGYKAGQEVDPSELSAAGSLYRNAHPSSGSKPRYGAMGSLLNSQEAEIKRRVDEHVTGQMTQASRAIDDWAARALRGDVAGMQKLNLDPSLYAQSEKNPSAWRALVEQARKSATTRFETAYRGQANKIHGADSARIRKARGELANAMGDETGIDLGEEEVPVIRPEFRALGDAMKAARGPRR